jgi:hypothetical protein
LMAAASYVPILGMIPGFGMLQVLAPALICGAVATLYMGAPSGDAIRKASTEKWSKISDMDRFSIFCIVASAIGLVIPPIGALGCGLAGARYIYNWLSPKKPEGALDMFKVGLAVMASSMFGFLASSLGVIPILGLAVTYGICTQTNTVDLSDVKLREKTSPAEGKDNDKSIDGKNNKLPDGSPQPNLSNNSATPASSAGQQQASYTP